MYPSSLNSVFESIGLSYGGVLPVAILVALCALLIPTLIKGSDRLADAVHACACVLLQGIGVILLSAGAIPALQAVLSGERLPVDTYLGLTIVFAVGGIIFLVQDRILHRLDRNARAVPMLLSLFTWKVVGVLVALYSGLSLLLQLLLKQGQLSGVNDATLLLYGLMLWWFTRTPATPAPAPFTPIRKIPVTPAPMAVPSKKKPIKPVKSTLIAKR